MDIVPLKTCTKCGLEKPATLDYFSRHKQAKSGLRPYCKVCGSAYSKSYYAAHPERADAYFKKYRAENAVKRRADAKAWGIANPEKRLAATRKWREAHRAKHNAANKVWQDKNPAKRRQYVLNRIARKHDAEGTHTAIDIVRQLEGQGGRCYYCGVKLKKSGKNKYHADHRIPLSKGGSNSPENIVVACPSCNQTKGTKSVLEFIGRLF